jgi:hypothetical protein
MTDTKEKKGSPVFGAYSKEQSEAFDAAAAEIMKDSEPEAPFDLGEEATQEAPEASAEEPETLVDEGALDEIREAYRRDGFDDEEIQSRLKRDGYKRFLSRGQRRQKKHREDDAAYERLRSLGATQQDSKGTTSEERGARSQAGTPPLNLGEVAAPLVEQLGLSEEGRKALVAALERSSNAKDPEIGALRDSIGLLGSVLQDELLEKARKSVGLDQADDEDWFRVQEHYQHLLRTPLHSELSGKHRMNALLRDAAKLAGVKAESQEEIQRKASIAKAKANGGPVVPRTQKLPDKPMTWDEQFDHMGSLITSGRFKSNEEARAYADKLRQRTRK